MIKRIFVGHLLGMTIGLWVAFIISCFFGGRFAAGTPTFMAEFSNPVIANIIAIFMAGMVGVLFSCADLIFEMYNTSLMRRSIWHFFVTFTGLSIINVLLKWSSWSVKGFAMFLTMFVVIYIIVWSVAYWQSRKMTLKYNNGLKTITKE